MEAQDERSKSVPSTVVPFFLSGYHAFVVGREEETQRDAQVASDRSLSSSPILMFREKQGWERTPPGACALRLCHLGKNGDVDQE